MTAPIQPRQSSARSDDWVGITCLGYFCERGCELIPEEGPAEPGWTWIDEHGWVCPKCIKGAWPNG